MRWRSVTHQTAEGATARGAAAGGDLLGIEGE